MFFSTFHNNGFLVLFNDDHFWGVVMMMSMIPRRRTVIYRRRRWAISNRFPFLDDNHGRFSFFHDDYSGVILTVFRSVLSPVTISIVIPVSDPTSITDPVSVIILTFLH
jgi:hypothetical protein